MIIHYNNGREEKLIRNVIGITVYSRDEPVSVILKNGAELTVNINHIEMILDDDIVNHKSKIPPGGFLEGEKR